MKTSRRRWKQLTPIPWGSQYYLYNTLEKLWAETDSVSEVGLCSQQASGKPRTNCRMQDLTGWHRSLLGGKGRWPARGSTMSYQAGKEGSPWELQPRVNEVLSSYPLRIISDSGLKDHLRTFARHPGIALGFSHKIHHPNVSLLFTVQYNPPFYPA